MHLEFMWKDADSYTNGCPALYQADRDGRPGYVVQGKRIGPDERAQARDLADDEDLVWVPANVLDRLPAGV